MKLLLLSVVLLVASCGLPSKVRAGFCSRGGCAKEYHEPYFACKFCGNCEKHCISAPFRGPNK